jgi:hypothetical protein
MIWARIEPGGAIGILVVGVAVEDVDVDVETKGWWGAGAVGDC